MPDSIFSDEWRDCLRAHYTYVVRMSDQLTEKTLRGVMYEAGFSEAELKELYVLATAHVDHVGADFVPDMELLAQEPATSATVVAMPQEMIEATLVEESVALDEANAADTAAEIEEAEMDEREIKESDDDESPPAAPDVTQLSLF